MIRAYIDGACRGNQTEKNVGAWAFRIELDHGITVEDSQAVLNTTNNIMELASAIECLKSLLNYAQPGSSDLITTEIQVFSDSQYVVKGLNEWSANWIRKGFAGVANKELWEYLINLKKLFTNISFVWVKGHDTSGGNLRVDLLCNMSMDNEKLYHKYPTPEKYDYEND